MMFRKKESQNFKSIFNRYIKPITSIKKAKLKIIEKNNN